MLDVGDVGVGIMCAYGGILYLAWMTAKHSSVLLAIALLVFGVHALYRVIFTLGYYRFIYEVTMHEFINMLETVSFGVNFFRPRNPFSPSSLAPLLALGLALRGLEHLRLASLLLVLVLALRG